jgi:molybdate transport system substrate-binding protein
MNRRDALTLAAVHAAAWSAGCGTRGQGALVVAASASLGDFVRSELGASSEPSLRAAAVVEGATATLARQIASGAPIHALVAADGSPWTGAGAAILRPPTVFAEGTLALLWARPPDRGLESLRADPAVRLALPDPSRAPFGRAAREVLLRAGLWTELAPRALVVESVRHALSLVDRGEVDAAFTARSLLSSRARPRLRSWTAIDRGAHGPLPHAASITGACPSRHAGILARWVEGLRRLPPDRLAAFGLEPLR